MCGRYSLSKDVRDLLDTYEVEIEEPPLFSPRYNAAPSMLLPVITDAEPRRLQFFRWGLTMPMWDKVKARNGMANLRSETVALPRWRRLLASKRCFVLADGFYEWKTIGKLKQPHRFEIEGGRLFAFAGLWDVWGTGNEQIHSFTLITTEPNAVVEKVHDRMPVILTKENERTWLDPNADAGEEILPLLHPYSGETTSYPVSTRLNSVANDEPELIRPVIEQVGLF